MDKLSRKQHSAYLVAILIFVSLNVVFYYCDKYFVFSAKYKNAVDFDFPGLNTIIDRDDIRKKEEVVLLGSSLFIYPIWDLDKIYGEHCGDPNHYHDARYLEEQLKQNHLPIRGVLNVGIGGAMVSDYYLMLVKLLSNPKRKVKLVVVDCAPRSFYDSGVTSANVTPIFNYFFNDIDAVRIGRHYFQSMQVWLAYLTEHHCYFYQNRRWAAEVCFTWLSDWLSKYEQAFIQTAKQEKKSKNSLIIDRTKEIALSLQEYKARYFGISNQAFAPQLMFLKLLADLCTQKQIKLLIVNMPLSGPNKKLLGDDIYGHYVSCLREVSFLSPTSIFFLDLSESKDYSIADFYDSVHLNSTGGRKLENHIVEYVSKVIQFKN